MPRLTTTLRRLRAADACKDRYDHLRECLGPEYGDDTPIDLLTILDHNGVQDCLWALRATAEPLEGIVGPLCADIAERVLPMYEAAYPDDNRPRLAIAAARTGGKAAAKAAARAAGAAKAAARAAGAAWAAAGAAWAAAGAAEAAGAAAWAAGAAEREAQAEIIRKHLSD